MSHAKQIADEVFRLIQTSPRTPTKAQLADCIQTMLDVVKDEGDAITVPLGTIVQPRGPGAFIRVEPNMSLTIDGWSIGSQRPLTAQESALAILEWMRKGVLTAPKQ